MCWRVSLFVQWLKIMINCTVEEREKDRERERDIERGIERE